MPPYLSSINWQDRHKHGFIPLECARILMNLSYKKTRLGQEWPGASFPLDLNNLLRNQFARLDEKGGKRGLDSGQ